MSSGGWTGEFAGKIQHHANVLYIQMGSSGLKFRNTSGTDVLTIANDGHFTSGSAITFDQDATFNGGTGAITITAGGDIRMSSGDWTGEHAGKIQFHSNKMYLQGGSSGHQLRDHTGGTTFEINPSGTCAGVNLTMGQDVTFNGGVGAITVAAGSDIRMSSGGWTGDSCKIQHHNNFLYIQGGTGGHRFRRSNGSDAWVIDSDGNFYPAANNTYDIGTTANRVRNIYTNDLNLSNKDGANDVDGTWGDFTIQEGESDLFLINNRSGKKYKFNLTEVS
tara:strand:- start:705 stop:1535 length:831 start_codon:yes stop_codon:yes gene_type:complete